MFVYFLNKKGFKSIIALAFALVIAIVAELNIFIYDTSFEITGKKLSLLDETNCEMNIQGYNIEANGTYLPTSADPNITFTDIKTDINSLLIVFSNNIISPETCRIFFASDGNFTEENSFIQNIPKNSKFIILNLPEGDFDDIRLDIDSKFQIDSVTATDGSIMSKRVAAQSVSLLRIITMFLFFSVLALMLLRWSLSTKPRKLSGFEILFIVFVFCYYFIWAIAKEYNYAPDEQMRFEVTRFLFDNNRLPVNDELLSNWGFSYAHFPTVLCSYFGYILMKVASIFTLNAHLLLLAARMVSVLCATGAVYFIIKLTKLIFATPARWIMIIMIALMPQFAFIASYVNNDSVALLGISIIAYSWALGIYDNWNIKNCLLLAVGISICAASYYNSYAWILLSVGFFIFSYLYKNKKDYKGMFKYAGIIAGAVLLLAGYSFIRHVVVYGDLLGFETTEYYGKLYAVNELRPDVRTSVVDMGHSLGYMLFDMQWIRITFKNFIGCFGYMEFYCPEMVYSLATIFFAVACVGCAVSIVLRLLKKQKPDVLKLVFYLCAVICAIITITLSIYNSYTKDFQPQGRYCYPALLTIGMVVAMGYDGLISLFKKEKYKYTLTAILCTMFTGIAFYVFVGIYLPT